jgi:hypothetical protein
MNPPTPGHLFIIRRLLSKAVHLGVHKIYVFLSSSQDNKNPLVCDEEQKKHILQKMIQSLKTKMREESPETKSAIHGVQVMIICCEKSPVLGLFEKIYEMTSVLPSELIHIYITLGEDRDSIKFKVEGTVFHKDSLPRTGMESASADGPAVKSASADGPVVKSASADGPAVKSASADGPAVKSASADGPAVKSASADGPVVKSASADGPVVKSASADGPAVKSASADGPAVKSALADGPAVKSALADGPAVKSALADGPAVKSALADGPAVKSTIDIGSMSASLVRKLVKNGNKPQFELIYSDYLSKPDIDNLYNWIDIELKKPLKSPKSKPKSVKRKKEPSPSTTSPLKKKGGKKSRKIDIKNKYK